MKKIVWDICSALPEEKLGVIGDFCVDAYWAMRPEMGEISIETGKKTIPVSPACYSPGGAGNIISNLRGIGMKKVHVFGPAGSDPFGTWLKNELSVPDCCTLETIERLDYHTPVYCKPLLNNVEQSRFDLGGTALSDSECDAILSSLRRILPELNVLIINEQITNGLHGEYFRKEFAALIKDYKDDVRFIFDGRNFLDAYSGVTLKINADAASGLAFGEKGRPPEESGKKILDTSGSELVITDGENGCFVFENSGITHIPAVRYNGPIDTVGAGDSFTAGFSCALACGKSLQEAAVFGTLCSAVTIRKINQTGVPTLPELLEICN